jgi:methylmalonyl-CoA mutase cobalamin-binding subunit
MGNPPITIPLQGGRAVIEPIARHPGALDSASKLIMVTSVASDSHTWNLVFLQILLEELGFPVVNLGPCTPDDLIVEECRRLRPAVLVVSSVNGHGHIDGRRLISRLRRDQDLQDLRVVIGGKLDVTGGADPTLGRTLLDAGFDAVFSGDAGPAELQRFLSELPPKALANGREDR